MSAELPDDTPRPNGYLRPRATAGTADAPRQPPRSVTRACSTLKSPPALPALRVDRTPLLGRSPKNGGYIPYPLRTHPDLHQHLTNAPG